MSLPKAGEGTAYYVQFTCVIDCGHNTTCPYKESKLIQCMPVKPTSKPVIIPVESRKTGDPKGSANGLITAARHSATKELHGYCGPRC